MNHGYDKKTGAYYITTSRPLNIFE